MRKIVIIGAGSGFGRRLSLDIMARESLRDSTIALCDVHAGRLGKLTRYLERAVEKYDLPTEIVASTDRHELLPDADYVITSVAVGGAAYRGFPFTAEKETPAKYGLDQSVADTIGVGGVFRFLRTGPVQHRFFKDMETHCPNAFALNYTNPMAMLTWLHTTDSNIRNVGLCHSVQGTTKMLADLIDVPYDEVTYQVAGINHMAWVLEFRRGHEDLYPRIREAAETTERDLVRFEMMRQFGRFVTESSVHNSEYLPYFRRTDELKELYGLMPRERRQGQRRRDGWRAWMNGDDGATMPEPELVLSHEYATAIVEAMVTNTPFLFNGNVMNNGSITNLPEECCVEVPCVADSFGVRAAHVGALPPQLAALNRSNVSVQELAVRAVINRDREAAFHACAVDPLAAATVSLPDMRRMFDELWDAERELLRWFEDGEIPEIAAP